MANGLTTTVTKIVEQTEEVELQLWQWSIERGDASTPSRMIFIFRALDGEGNYREDVKPLRLEVADDAEDEVPTKATDLRALVMGAVVPESELATAYGVTGLTIREAGIAVVSNL